MSTFLNAAMTKDARTWNNAVSHSTSGSSVLDYFAKCGSYRGRTPAEVSADVASILSEDPELGMKIIFYNRMITRKVKGFGHETEKVQRGQGQKDEFVKSLAWLENNKPDLLYDNLWLVPVVGTWKDMWYDSAATGFYYYIAPDRVYALIRKGLKSEYHRGLLAKYLPKIRSRRNIKNDRHRRLNDWARGLCQFLGWTEAQYRRFKSNPENSAHLYQRLMCSGEWDNIDFNMIPGKALFNLINQKGKDRVNAIDRHNLQAKYLEWIKSQPVAKFTGYPYELYKAAGHNRDLAKTWTLNKQFDGLIKTATEDISQEVLNKGVLCALDTSGSMSMGYGMGGIQDAGVAPIDICCGLGIYFSKLLQGHFKDHVIMFDDQSRFMRLQGDFCDRVDQINRSTTAWGGTNFQSVIDEIVRVRRDNPHIPVEDYPQILLVVSDMQFNPAAASSHWGAATRYTSRDEQTNYETAMQKLANVGLPKMTIIWWHVNGRFTGDVPNKMDDEGTVMISGFDGAIVTAILGGQEEIVDEKTGQKRKLTPYESMVKALDQEILNKIKT